MRPYRVLTVTLLAVALALTACSERDDDDPSGDTLEGSWQLVSGVPTVEGWPITLNLEQGTIGGVAACNLYGGDVTIDGSDFELGPISITERGCEPRVMASEQAYMEALLAVDQIALDGDALVLSGPPDVELRFERLPEVPEAELTDTMWLLETLIEGDAATTPQGEPVTLELRSDGTLHATTGCRTLTGTWSVSGSMLMTPSLRADGECSPQLEQQDQHVIGVLEGEITPEIDGDRLTLSVAGGEALVYRAQGD